MTGSQTRKIIIGLALCVLIVLAFVAADKRGYVNQFQTTYFPCRQPITYSLGQFDSRFGISQSDFLNAVNQAVQIWDSPVKKELFKYVPDDSAGLKINLIYDSRQQETERLKQLGLVINDDQSSYDKLKAQYDLMKSEYTTEKAAIDATLKDYNAAKAKYDAQVQYWNSRGGAPRDVYNELQQQRVQLNNTAAQIQARENTFNQLVDNLNAVATALNRLGYELNLDVSNYNSEGASAGEFQEGLYRRDSSGTSIDIYQFENKDKLVRVLAHELGHALGLEHVDDPHAIMYKFNEGKNLNLTQTDVSQLKSRCGLN